MAFYLKSAKCTHEDSAITSQQKPLLGVTVNDVFRPHSVPYQECNLVEAVRSVEMVVVSDEAVLDDRLDHSQTSLRPSGPRVALTIVIRGFLI